ncbi:MAG TPA: type II toxin-antitoxin system RatA family toxin [Alphaproteobacteria bacterium]|nr:type II toxin-antitoxin system RatA family toxin [Alphaproteobacteria bacterium]
MAGLSRVRRDGAWSTVVTSCRDVRYSPRQMFELVADIESYPRFLPEYAAARIERRDGDTLRVRQVLRLPGRRLDFTTLARLRPPRSIDITGIEGPFRTLRIGWTFAARDAGGCRIRYRMEYALSSRLLALLADRMMPGMARRTLAAFDRRARQVYGPALPTA